MFKSIKRKHARKSHGKEAMMKLAKERIEYQSKWRNDFESSPCSHVNQESVQFIKREYQVLLSKYGSGYLVLYNSKIIGFFKEYGMADIQRFLYADANSLDYHECDIFEIGEDIYYG